MKQYRVYLNNFETAYNWAIDEGHGTLKQHFKNVSILVPCMTVVKIDVPDPQKDAQAWILCEGILKTFKNEDAIIS